jgi:hypothetical protein
MPLEAKRFRHVAVAIPQVVVAGLLTAGACQQCPQPQQPDITYHQSVEFGREESRRSFQIALTLRNLLPMKPLQLCRLLSGRTYPRTGIDLGLAHPLAHRLGRADPEQTGNLAYRRPLQPC